MTDTVLLERRAAPYVLITLNRPTSSTPWTSAHARPRPGDAQRSPATRARVLLRGAGRAFMAGGTSRSSMRTRHARARFQEMGEGFHASVKRLRTMPKPVLACVHGAVAGGACR